MTIAHALRLYASLLILLSGQMNAQLGPTVDFNAQSFHWTIEDITNNAGFARMEVRCVIGDTNITFYFKCDYYFPQIVSAEMIDVYMNVATTEMFKLPRVLKFEMTSKENWRRLKPRKNGDGFKYTH